MLMTRSYTFSSVVSTKWQKTSCVQLGPKKLPMLIEGNFFLLCASASVRYFSRSSPLTRRSP